jgi:HYDIN/CFA65/VesB family protein
MGVLFRRAAVITGVAAVLIGSVAGIASASSPPAPAWSGPGVSAGSFDYGSVNAGTTVTPAATFTLTNNGGSATAALKVTVTGTAFALENDHCTGTSLGPRKSCTVQVAYTASTPGGVTDTGTLTAKGVKPNTTATLKLQGESTAAAKITGVTEFGCTPGSIAGLAVTGTGFLPNTRLTFTVSGAGVLHNHLNNFPGVTTDATGAFNSGEDLSSPFIEVGSEAGSVTVTATDGTNTATGTFSYPGC